MNEALQSFLISKKGKREEARVGGLSAPYPLLLFSFLIYAILT